MILDGNELPTQKTAVLSRMVLLNFDSNKFCDKQQKAFKKLNDEQDNGFGLVLTDILKHRNYFKENFKITFSENMKELREVMPKDFAERTMKHIALLLTPAKLLINKLQFPFAFYEITRAIVSNAENQNQLLKQTDELSIFWTAFANGIKNNNLIAFNRDQFGNNKKSSHYNLKSTDNETILQIKLSHVFPEYVKYCKNNGQRFLDQNSLKMLLTSNSYEPFIQSHQKKRGDSYTDKYFGSCYQFHIETTENVYTINDIELNV